MIQGTPEQVLAFCRDFTAMQGEFTTVEKTGVGEVGKTGATRKFKYLDYATLVEYLRPLLAKHGFFHCAAPGSSVEKAATAEGGEGLVAVASGTVSLYHRDGGFMQASYALSVGNARDAGAVHTYFRRYGLAGLVGIAADEDTDAAGIDPPAPPRQQARQQPPPQQKQQARQPDPGVAEGKQIVANLNKMAKSLATSEEDYQAICVEVAEYSKDTHGSTPSELAARGEVHKLREVYDWLSDRLTQGAA